MWEFGHEREIASYREAGKFQRVTKVHFSQHGSKVSAWHLAFTVCLLVGREEKSRWEKEWGEGDRRKERRMGCKREGECDEDEQKYREWIVSPVSYRRK